MRKSLIFEFFIGPIWAINEQQTVPLPTEASILSGYCTFETHTRTQNVTSNELGRFYTDST